MPKNIRLSGGKTAPLQVENMSFMLERLGKDCAPLQFIRELTQNSVEAIVSTPEQEGEIYWDVDWTYLDLEDVFKLSITDNGIGMTGEEMVRYINHLASSSGIQSFQKNFGVGAKIAAGTRSTHGMIYLSWKNGMGSQIHFWKDPDTDKYGLKQLQLEDGSYAYWAPVDDAVKPDLIKDHGTKVILLGKSEDEDTMTAPALAKVQTKWIRKYLNSRYVSFPEGIVVRAREGWEHPRSNTDLNVLRRITGQIPYLEDHKEASGIVTLDSATARWWILKDEKALTQNSSQIESTGHIAALYQNELHELRTGKSGIALLQQFGVVFGARRVVIYVEVDTSIAPDLTANTARTSLRINDEPLPWAAWAHEFREKMPQAIKDHMDTVAAGSQSQDHSESIQNRLKQVEQFFHLSRYRPITSGGLSIDPTLTSPGGIPREISKSPRRPSKNPGGTGGRSGSVYSLFQTKDGVPGAQTSKTPYPKVDWISLEEGTREEGVLEDRAARYLPDAHQILINADFRVFVDMIKRWEKEYQNVPAVGQVIREAVREWFEQQLIEAIMGSFGLKGSREWTDDELRTLISDEALTAVVLPRYHTDQNIGRSLGTRLGSRKARAS